MTQTNQTSVALDAPGTKRGIDRGALVAWAKEQYPLYILIVLLVIAGFATDAFFTQRNSPAQGDRFRSSTVPHPDGFAVRLSAAWPTRALSSRRHSTSELFPSTSSGTGG